MTLKTTTDTTAATTPHTFDGNDCSRCGGPCAQLAPATPRLEHSYKNGVCVYCGVRRGDADEVSGPAWCPRAPTMDEVLPPLTEAELEQNAVEMLTLLARVARDKKSYISVGGECWDTVVQQGGKITSVVDLCHGTVTDTVELSLHGYRVVCHRWGRKPTDAEFEAAVVAQRAKVQGRAA